MESDNLGGIKVLEDSDEQIETDNTATQRPLLSFHAINGTYSFQTMMIKGSNLNFCM